MFQHPRTVEFLLLLLLLLLIQSDSNIVSLVCCSLGSAYPQSPPPPHLKINPPVEDTSHSHSRVFVVAAAAIANSKVTLILIVSLVCCGLESTIPQPSLPPPLINPPVEDTRPSHSRVFVVAAAAVANPRVTLILSVLFVAVLGQLIPPPPPKLTLPWKTQATHTVELLLLLLLPSLNSNCHSSVCGNVSLSLSFSQLFCYPQLNHPVSVDILVEDKSQSCCCCCTSSVKC